MNYMQGDGRGLGGGPPPPRPTSGYIQHQHLQGHQHHQPPHLGGGMQGPHHGQQQHPALQQQHHAYQQQAQHQPPAQHHPPLPSTASSMSHHHGMGSNGGMGNNLMGSNGGLGIGSSLDDDQLFKQFLKQDTGSSGVVDLEYDGDDAFQKMEEELMNNDYLFDAPIMQMPPVGADALSNPPSAPLSSGRSNGQQQTASGRDVSTSIEEQGLRSFEFDQQRAIISLGNRLQRDFDNLYYCNIFHFTFDYFHNDYIDVSFFHFYHDHRLTSVIFTTATSRPRGGR
ncbi:uncharacterized protein ACA1_364560 [Acanthamoeba castellanii str. Neff]|uniref:Uncharacterized protein n=1 Tax=Acanthamoeba castellanii (strain ATCC 30010 / Neff) TaxID=1257118 RepID=L8GME4_ACACF|nr:uncharacterized protein ACA1_364560 [Acanthamoeba castellanii str. Neff]ELR13928.1 hypothetical protein ACA1_364560 [Acanthamoeba castellanii str. Neff]